MTDYELISLYSEQIALFNTTLTVLVTVLFSYLVAMYFVSHRLSGILFWMLNGLFILIMYAQSGGVFASGTRANNIGVQIMARIESEGSDIAIQNWQADQSSYYPQRDITFTFDLEGYLFGTTNANLV